MRKRNILIGSGILLILDQLSKSIVSRRLVLGQLVPVIGDLFRLRYITNPGGVFGLSFWGVPLLPISFVAVALLLILLFRTELRGMSGVGLSLILGGGMGNLIDRLSFGEVIDFLDFGFGTYRWPTFNLADAGVTIGVVLFILGSWRMRRKE